jgi:hypothetical protein
MGDRNMHMPRVTVCIAKNTPAYAMRPGPARSATLA